MHFSKTELKALEQIALGKLLVSDITLALNKGKSQIYRIIKSLDTKAFVKLEDKKIKPVQITHVQILLQELSRQPSFIDDISGCGLKLYLFILEDPKTIEDIEKGTGIKRSTIFYKLKKARRKSFVRKENNQYQFNSKLWKGLNEFFIELKKYEETNDKRIPPGAVVYYKTDKEIVFSTKADCDASLTGFSEYTNYGIKIYTIDNMYYLPKKRLLKKDIFIHSLYRCEKDRNIQNLIILALFYLKYKRELLKIPHEIIGNLNKSLKGERIKDYPTLAEIKDRAEIYDIKL